MLMLIGERHTANWHSCLTSYLQTIVFMHIGVTSFSRQVVYKFMCRCAFYFRGQNFVFKKLLDLQLNNQTVTGFGFRMIVKLF